MAKKHLFWIDLEMSGLDPRRDRILEVAVIVTDKHLKPKARFETAVYQDPALLRCMGEWCTQHHGESGLLARVPGGMKEEAVDAALVELATKFFKKNPVIIAGNSIAHDRKFIEAYLPRFTAMLHYRMLDVSSFKIVFTEIFSRPFKKRKLHRALDDIEESIAELRYYVSAIDPERMPELPEGFPAPNPAVS